MLQPSPHRGHNEARQWTLILLLTKSLIGIPVHVESWLGFISKIGKDESVIPEYTHFLPPFKPKAIHCDRHNDTLLVFMNFLKYRS